MNGTWTFDESKVYPIGTPLDLYGSTLDIYTDMPVANKVSAVSLKLLFGQVVFIQFAGTYVNFVDSVTSDGFGFWNYTFIPTASQTGILGVSTSPVDMSGMYIY
jgi:hypothetical protein